MNNPARSFSYVKKSARQTFKHCLLCQQPSRCDFAHYLSQCPHLPESDRNFISMARLISDVEDVESESEQVFGPPVSDNKPVDPVNSHLSLTPVSRRIQLEQSPFLNLYYDHFPLKVVIDSGATANLIKESTAHFIKCPISKSSQVAIVGETRLVFLMTISPLFLKALLLII